MVMKRYKLIVILICVLTISVGVVSTFLSRDGEDSMLVANEGDEMTLDEVQYQLLKDSIRNVEIEEMSSVRRRNAWLILDKMKEIKFVENTYPGESWVAHATWILDLLDVGQITELFVVRVNQNNSLAAELILRIVNEEDSTYYIWYNRTWGLGMVTTESENGEIIYDSIMHTIINGQICEREYPRGPAMCNED